MENNAKREEPNFFFIQKNKGEKERDICRMNQSTKYDDDDETTT